MRNLFLLLIVVLLSGCASTYSRVDTSQPIVNLNEEKSVLIATPANGSYNDTEYPSSGKMLAQAVKAVFEKFSADVELSETCRDLSCLKRNSEKTVGYYVVPEIIHWEDRATEWSGRRDKVEIKLMVFDGKTSEKLASTIISGKSKLMTFGGDHPQDLLEEPLWEYVDSLY